MTEIFQYEFMRRAVAAAILGGASCGIVGVWVLLLGIPFVGVAMSHAAFAGAVFGLLTGINPLISSLVFSIGAAALIGPLADRGDVDPGISVGVIFSFVLGLAFLGIGFLGGSRAGALDFMWGNILTVSSSDVILTAAVLAAIVSFIILFYKEILSVIFDRKTAEAAGIPQKTFFWCLLTMTGATVALNLNAVGGLLIFGLIINPPLAAYQLTYDLKKMYILAGAFGAASALTGLAVSWAAPVPAGAAIVISSGIILLAAMFLSPKKMSGGTSSGAGRKHFFDGHAHRWDKMMPSDTAKRVRETIAPLLGIKKSDRVLDAGSGTGILLPCLKEVAGSGGEVTALDFSSEMLKKSRARHGDGFKYVCADAADIPLEPDYFDAVVCFAAFPHFPDKQSALKSMTRVAKPGGKILIALAESPAVINRMHRSIGGAVGGDFMPENSEMKRLLENAGLVSVSIKEGKGYYIAEAFKPQ